MFDAASPPPDAHTKAFKSDGPQAIYCVDLCASLLSERGYIGVWFKRNLKNNDKFTRLVLKS